MVGLGVQFFNELNQHVKLGSNEKYTWRASREGTVFINDGPIHAPTLSRIVQESIPAIESGWREIGLNAAILELFGTTTSARTARGLEGDASARILVDEKEVILEVRQGRFYIDGQLVA